MERLEPAQDAAWRTELKDSTDTKHLELVIVGGGPAGMSAALVAGRGLIQTVIINEEAPRNAVTTASHGFLTQDGKHPIDILATAKDQLAKYTNVEYIKGIVSDIRHKNDGFYITIENGLTLWAERVVA
jgi:thioredoxin reductase